MNNKAFDASRINEGMKKNWTLSQFLEYYEASEEEFVMRLYKLYRYEKKTPTELLNRMKKNEKRQSRNKRKKNNPTVAETTPIARATPIDASVPEAKFIMPTSIPSISSDVEVVSNTSLMIPIIANIKERMASQNSEDEKDKLDITISPESIDEKTADEVYEVADVLEQSKAELEQAKNYLCELEKDEKRIRADNRKLEQKLLKAEEILNSFAKQLEKQKTIVLEVLEDMKANQDKLKENKELIEIAREEKRKLEEKIAQMQSIKVWFGGKDNLTSDSIFDYYEEDVEVDTALIASRMSELFQTEVADLLDDLSVKQVKQIAKILLILEQIQKEVGDKNIELFFTEATPITEILEKLGKKVVIK